MRDLAPYQPVSHMPPIRRDVSVAVSSQDAPHLDSEEGWAETVGDRIRGALGAAAELVESVQVLSETSYDQLSPAAQERLGIEPGQVNLLVRVTLRGLDRTLTDADANAVRDEIYAALHQGSASVVGLRT